MSLWQKLVIAFWIFVGIMLLWNFSSYNTALTKDATDNPQQQHFYFLHTNAPAATAPVHHDGPDVRQTAFVIQPDTPSVGNYTCLVTLKNFGNVEATNVQICVRPYRGVSTLDIDVGGGRGGPLSDDDPISQISDWLNFPDLAPGESSTRGDVFLNRKEIQPGSNPNPRIIFEAAKPAAAAPPAPTPQHHPAD